MEDVSPTPSLPKRLGVRFGLIYAVLFALQDGGSRLRAPLVDLLGATVFHLPTPIPNVPSGSGDRLFDWLSTLLDLILAVLGAAVWMLLDRKRRDPVVAYEALRIVLRYYLGFILLTYGFGKAAQFPMPGTYEYTQPLGETTPMGLMWTFTGYSVPYAIFAGVLEVGGAFLLFFRRTTTLGALACAVVLTNVFVMNLCYDVPVKRFSFHLLLAALVLLLPDARRLLDVLVLNRPTEPRPLGPPVRYRKLRIGVLGAKWALIVLSLAINVAGAVQGWRYSHPATGHLEGIWTVDRFDSKLPVWEWAMIEQGDWGGAIVVHLRDGGTQKARLADDGSRLKERDRHDKPLRAWTYRLDGPRLTLISDPKDPPARIELHRDDMRFPLMRHGFHWIQERPRTP